MTTVEKSPRVIHCPMRRPIFDPKETTRYGIWNVRTLYQTGKLAQFLYEFDSYRMDILGISEMRWAGSGKMVSDGKMVLYSGHAQDHARGVGFILSRRATTSLLAWKPISDRLTLARFQARHVKVTILQVYAPTEEADDTDKDGFYAMLRDAIDNSPRHDLLIVGGDFNAQISSNRDGLESTIGPFGIATMTNENGGRLISFCEANRPTIKNTFFGHKRIHKVTWKAPGGRYTSEIDYICISSRWASTISDVRVWRGADIDSDHYLLIAKCKLHLKRLQPRLQRPSPFNIQRLKDANTAAEFQLELRNHFQLLAAEGNNNKNPDTLWDELKEAVVGAAESKIGRRRGGFKERWISDRSWELIDQHRLGKSVRDQVAFDPHASADQRERAMATYQDLARQVKRSCWRDKREWIEAKGIEAQETADRNDT
ncbi:craniofacial development protein 2-like [Astatotilapia calliptera]|uniref:craniofacial development protein 2-like n=1 Tax=Astatotilapia calliptera TaxID=8154 RepID=UPI000E4096DA|nr:craniofacial development protein 2-like [Astatotilapia calliptera]